MRNGRHDDGRGEEAMMKVKDLMTTEVKTCVPGTSVAEAAHLMWEGDCGILPVLDDGKLVGLVTDRDMYIALATQNARAAQLTVGDVATRTLVTCAPEDGVLAALAGMKQARVRRLPVVGFGGTLLGILSMNDIVRAAGAGTDVPSDEIVATLQAICGRHHPAPHVAA
jgi:CBS domain-containing protein